MRFVFPLLVVLFACVVAPAQDKKPTAKEKARAKAVEADMKALIGQWRVAGAVLGGANLTEQLKVLTFEVHEGGKYTAKHGEQKDEGTFTVDPTKKPKEMDLKPTGGPLKGKDVKAIYLIRGNTLTVCYDHEKPETAPKKFESPPNSTLLLISYVREAKKRKK